MPLEPEIKILPYKHRQQFFWVLLILFIVALPTMIFYTTGHRLNLGDKDNRIVTTGGIYVTTDNLEVDVYLDSDQVKRPRLFRSAYYIQNIEAGEHRVVVQKDGLHTWVKELPVDPYIVIEAAAFNMPTTPHLRPVTEYTNGFAAVFFSNGDVTEVFEGATTTVPYLVASTSATTSYFVNPEYDFVTSLFSTTSTSSVSVFDRFFAEVEKFGFATTTVNTVEATSTSFIERGNIRLVQHGSDIYARWTGPSNAVPYYFCVNNLEKEEMALRYGEHVAAQVFEQRLSTSTPLVTDGDRVCRQEIKIDRKRQDVFLFDFVPGSSDLVLLQLEDGLYVTEIDDRAWQNTQLLYRGADHQVVVYNDTIYIKKGEQYFEVLTNIESN